MNALAKLVFSVGTILILSSGGMISVLMTSDPAHSSTAMVGE